MGVDISLLFIYSTGFDKKSIKKNRQEYTVQGLMLGTKKVLSNTLDGQNFIKMTIMIFWCWPDTSKRDPSFMHSGQRSM